MAAKSKIPGINVSSNESVTLEIIRNCPEVHWCEILNTGTLLKLAAPKDVFFEVLLRILRQKNIRLFEIENSYLISQWQTDSKRWLPL